MKNKSLRGYHVPKFNINSYFLNTMKTLFVFLFAFASTMYAVTGSSQNVKVTIQRESSSLKKVLNDIETQTEYLFIVNSDVDTREKVTVTADRQPLAEVLDDLSRQVNMKYIVSQKHIVLAKTPLRHEADSKMRQPTSVIRGTVVDESGEPLIGVNVVVRDKHQGAISDAEGHFKLEAEAGDVLIVSYIGYVTQNVKVSSLANQLKIVLEEDARMLDEVVAIGYGSVKRKDITGSVTSMDNSILSSVPANSPAQAMAGKLAGVKVTMPEGNPDAEVIIRVRGGGSITSDNTPLYIVDGFPVSSISDIPSTDIESIDVLKDASSTAIYGSRGANGIILITTKSGQKGKVTVNYNAYYSTSKVAKRMDVLNTYDYLNWQYELHGLRNITSEFVDLFGTYDQLEQYKDFRNIDWQDAVFGRTGTSFNHNVSINGGNEKMRFNFSYAHVSDKGILELTKFIRDNFSLKLNYEASKKVQLDFSAKYSRAKSKGDGMNGATGATNDQPSNSFGRIKHSVIQMPIHVNLSQDNIDTDELDNGLYDPILALQDNYKERLRTNYNFNASFNWEIIRNLKWKTDIGLDETRTAVNNFYGMTTSEAKSNALPANAGMPLVQASDYSSRVFRNTNTLNYVLNHFLPENHSLSVLLGEEMIITTSDKLTARYEGLPDFFTAAEAFKFSGEGDPVRYNRFYYPDDKLLSFFSRLNYDFKGRYLATFTIRGDGSSKFTAGNQWGIFPSGALAWRLSEEEFLKRDWLSNLKLRLSYGVSGNNNIPADQTGKIFSVAEQKKWLNITDTWWTAGTTLNNPDLKWESTYSTNVGVDFGFFNNRLNGSVDLYKNKTKDLLMQFTISGSGYNTQYRNIGETENKGVEVTLNYAPVQKKDYGVDISLVLGFNKNKIVSLGSLSNGYTVATSWQNTEVGADYLIKPEYAVGQMWGFVTDGRYEVSDFKEFDGLNWVLKEGVADGTDVIGGDAVRPGGLKLKDLTDDGRITEDDKTIIGDANPVCTGGFTVGGYWKGFDLNMNFTWSLGNDIYNADKIEFTSPTKYQWRNMTTIMEAGKRWTNLNEDGTICNDPDKLAAMNAHTSMWSPFMNKSIFHSWAVEDGSFLRLNTLTIGYTFPQEWMKRLYVSNLRLYFTGTNLFCLTNYSGFDPEVDTRRNYRVTPGVDYSAYPKSRQYVFGVNLSF